MCVDNYPLLKQVHRAGPGLESVFRGDWLTAIAPRTTFEESSEAA